MSNYRLTEKNVKELELTETTWQTVKDCGIGRVFIRAHEDADTYGPYMVKDAKRQMIARLDGTEPRPYPRDKGLFVKKADLPYSMTGLSRWSKVGHTVDGNDVYIKPVGKGDHCANLDILLREVTKELDATLQKAKALTYRKEAIKAAIEALK